MTWGIPFALYVERRTAMLNQVAHLVLVAYVDLRLPPTWSSIRWWIPAARASPIGSNQVRRFGDVGSLLRIALFWPLLPHSNLNSRAMRYSATRFSKYSLNHNSSTRFFAVFKWEVKIFTTENDVLHFSLSTNYFPVHHIPIYGVNIVQWFFITCDFWWTFLKK